jgi:hypothetical protein
MAAIETERLRCNFLGSVYWIRPDLDRDPHLGSIDDLWWPEWRFGAAPAWFEGESAELLDAWRDQQGPAYVDRGELRE